MRSVVRLGVLAVLAGCLLALGAGGIALAQGSDLNGKLRTGPDVTVPSGQTINHDLYAFAGTVVVDGTVQGDLTAAGGNVTVNGTVSGDVVAAAGTLVVNGQVGGNVRAAGGTIRVGGQVGRDLAMAGGTLDVAGRVGGDVIATGGDLRISGAVAGGTAGTVASYTRSGTVGGTDGITVNAPSTPPARASNAVLDAVRQFVAVLLVGLIALWLWPRVVRAIDAEVRERPLRSLGLGLVGIVGYVGLSIVIIVAGFLLGAVFAALGFGVLAGIDFVGVVVAVAGLTLAFVVAVAFLADVIVGLALARLILRRTGGRWREPGSAAPTTYGTMPPPDSPESRGSASGGWSTGGWPTGRWSDLAPLILGAAIVVILTSLPVVGGWLKLLVVLLGLGGIVWAIWRWPQATTLQETRQPG